MSIADDSPVMNLRNIADLYEQQLRTRNSCANRLRSFEQGADEGPGPVDYVADHPLLNRLNEGLAETHRFMELSLAEHPVYRWLMGVPGVNRSVAARLIGLIPMNTEEDFASFSKLRTFSGYTPGRNKLVKGEKAPFSVRLKTQFFVAFSQLLKAQGTTRGKPWAPKNFYAEIYHNWRNIYKERHGDVKAKKGLKAEDRPEWPRLRQHFAAKNKLVDVFSVHIWRKWREGMGWSVRSLYVHEKLGHQMDYDADDFSSPAMAERKIKAHAKDSATLLALLRSNTTSRHYTPGHSEDAEDSVLGEPPTRERDDEIDDDEDGGITIGV